MQRNRSVIVTLIATLGYICGCSGVSLNSPASTPADSNQVFATLSQKTPTKEAPTVTLPNEEILGAAPWLFFYPGMFVSNMDGSAFTRLELPQNSQYYWMSFDVAVAAHGGFISVEVFPSENEAEIWIIKLPELGIRKISLLGEQALQVIAEYRMSEIPHPLPPPVMGSLVNQHLLWSPDGRYLAFAGALDGTTTDVYVYDRIEDTVRRLSSGSAQSWILGWSPDSHWIINASVDDFSIAGFGLRISDVWAASVHGDTLVKLYQANSGRETIVGWASNNMFIAASDDFEVPLWGLKEVNAATGDVYPLYSPMFSDVAFDPRTLTLILAITQYMGTMPKIPPGLYRQVIGEGQPQMIVPGNAFFSLQWNPSISFFSYRDGKEDIHTFDSRGQPGPVFQNASALFPSPDGKWILTLDKALQLYDRLGNRVTEIGPTSNAVWLADSSGFVRWRSDNDEIMIYSNVDGWKVGMTRKLTQPPDSIWSFGVVYP